MREVLIIGSGISGMACAIRCARRGMHATLAAPYPSERSQSVMAAGGINAVLPEPECEPGDSVACHVEDTLKGGAFLAGPEAVAGLCGHAAEILRDLERIGTVFSVDRNGRPQRRAFGGQSYKRTNYCGAGTGKMIDDMVFDDQGGFYFTDLAGTKADRSAGVFYVEPDYKTVHPVINDGMIATNGIVLDPSGRNLWVTEYGTALLHRFTLAEDRHTIEPAFSYTAYHFTGLEGPDSMHIDEDGDLYIAICGQARFMVFNANGFPIGQILLPGREKGEMEKSTHLAIRPGTNEAYMCSADLKRNVCSIFRARVFAKAYRSYQFQ